MESTNSAGHETTLRILLPSGDLINREIEQGEIQIGKGRDNDIVIGDPAISTSHALIRGEGEDYTLTDLGSYNGTRVNGKRITEPYTLRHGDVIGMGQSKVTFRMGNQSETIDLQSCDIEAVRSQQILPLTEESLASAIVAQGLVPKSEIERLRGTGTKARSLYQAITAEQLTSEESLRDLMGRIFNIPTITLAKAKVQKDVSLKFPARLAMRTQTVPVAIESERLTLAIADPTEEEAINEVKRMMNLPLELRLATLKEIAYQIDRFYGPKLIGVLPSGEKVEYAVNKEEMELGKAAHNQIIVSDATVSKKHAKIISLEGGYSIMDLASSNGTYVNGKKQGGDARLLRNGDAVQLGKVMLTFTNPAETIGGSTEVLSEKELEDVRKLAQAAAAGGKEVKVAEKKKKKAKDSRFTAALIGATSRIVAQVIAGVMTIMIALYVTKRSLDAAGTSGTSPASQPAAQSTDDKDNLLNELTPAPGWFPVTGGKYEPSGIVHVPGTGGFLFVSDQFGDAVHWMEFDRRSNQLGSVKTIPLGVEIDDPEGITSDGSLFYMISSQSHPKAGGNNALVRFTFDSDTRELTGPAEIVPNLRRYLVANVAELKDQGEQPGAQGGLNIEGLAWDPENKRLMLGLRSPVLNGHALIVSLKVPGPGTPFSTDNLKIAQPGVIKLPLGGQGIRDLAYDQRLQSFLIISGMPDTMKKTDFTLWKWKSDKDSRPIEVTSLPKKMKPEGITGAKIGTSEFVLIVGDSNFYTTREYSDIE